MTSNSGGRPQAKKECGVVTKATAPFKKGSVFYEGSQYVFLQESSVGEGTFLSVLS